MPYHPDAYQWWLDRHGCNTDGCQQPATTCTTHTNQETTMLPLPTRPVVSPARRRLLARHQGLLDGIARAADAGDGSTVVALARNLELVRSRLGEVRA